MNTPPQWPAVYAAIVAALPSLPGFADVAVYDGYPVTQDQPLDSVTVGFVSDESAGTFQQTPDPSGYGVVETGQIRSMIRCNAGETDPTVTRSRAFALFAAWSAWVNTDQTLGGVLSEQAFLQLSADVDSVQASQGSATGLLVTLSYQTTVLGL